MKEAFFYKDHNDTSVYHPTSFARGPWSPKTLHGRVLSGLIAYEVETNCLSEEEIDDFQATRMTIDLFRPPPMSALTLSSKIIRSGKRIKVIDVNGYHQMTSFRYLIEFGATFLTFSGFR